MLNLGKYKRTFALILILAVMIALPAYCAVAKKTSNVIVTRSMKIWQGGSSWAEINTKGTIWIEGSICAEINKKGTFWKNGSIVGEITSTGKIYVGGSSVGELDKKSGSYRIWRNGSIIGEITAKGTIYLGGSIWGEVSPFSGSMQDAKAVTAILVFFVPDFGFLE